METGITSKTQLACLLGNPVSRSLSPRLFNTAFRQMNVDCIYLAFPVGVDKLPDAVKGLRAVNTLGFNLTLPNKSAMCSLCDRLSPISTITDTVNTVVIEDGILTGYLSDGDGFMRYIAGSGFDIIGRNMTIFGIGGIASSIIAQAALDGVRLINIFIQPDTDILKKESFLSRVRKYSNCMIYIHELGDKAEMSRCVQESAILVNASPGEYSENLQASALNQRGIFHKNLLVTDLIYKRKPGFLARAAKASGCHLLNGTYMLLYQAASSFYLWTGKEMPVRKVYEKSFAISKHALTKSN